MPMPFYTMKIKQRKIVVIQLKRILTVSMLYRFHHAFIRLDLVIKCIKFHLSPPPFFRHDPLYFTILYNKQRIYSSESDIILRYYTKRIVVAPWNTVNGNEMNTTAAAVLAPYPLLNLTGCVVCGFSVGIMWPGTISISSSKIPLGGTALFALLAMAGDMGGSIGPFVIGFVTQNTGDDLKAGMLAGCIFPAVLILSVFLLRQRNAEQK